MNVGIILVAHGSRKSSANKVLMDVAELLSLNQEYPIVVPAYLEIAEPDIPAAIDQCVEKGAVSILLIPYFLLEGSHFREDLPKFVETASIKYPNVPIKLGKSFGFHPILTDIILDRIKESK